MTPRAPGPVAPLTQCSVARSSPPECTCAPSTCSDSRLQCGPPMTIWKGPMPHGCRPGTGGRDSCQHSLRAAAWSEPASDGAQRASAGTRAHLHGLPHLERHMAGRDGDPGSRAVPVTDVQPCSRVRAGHLLPLPHVHGAHQACGCTLVLSAAHTKCPAPPSRLSTTFRHPICSILASSHHGTPWRIGEAATSWCTLWLR